MDGSSRKQPKRLLGRGAVARQQIVWGKLSNGVVHSRQASLVACLRGSDLCTGAPLWWNQVGVLIWKDQAGV